MPTLTLKLLKGLKHTRCNNLITYSKVIRFGGDRFMAPWVLATRRKCFNLFKGFFFFLNFFKDPVSRGLFFYIIHLYCSVTLKKCKWHWLPSTMSWIQLFFYTVQQNCFHCSLNQAIWDHFASAKTLG